MDAELRDLGDRTGRSARAAGFSTRKTLEDFSFDHQPWLKRETIAHLATALGLRATQLGHRVLFATATGWVTRLQGAHQTGRLSSELVRFPRYGLIIVDEVGYFPFEQDAANLFLQLVSSRYEDASMILTSNLSFARWGDVLGDQVVASAMATASSTTRKSHAQRLQVPAQEPPDRIAALDKTRKYGRTIPSTWLSFHPTKRLNFRPALTR